MKDKKVGMEFGEEVAGRTIVGGRGTIRKSEKVSIPVGIEKVLYLAATDPAFKERLFRDRAGVLADPAMKIDESERAILSGVPDGQLLGMIQNIDPEKHGRRKFIRSVAACAASLVAGSVFVECGEEDKVGGITPGFDAGGARPDVSEFGPVDAGGNRPDVPDWPDGSTDAETADAEVTDGGDAVEVDDDANAFPDVHHGVDAGGARPDVPEWPQDASDDTSPDHVEIDVDSGQSYGILPDAGEPDRVEVDLDGAQPAGIMPNGGEEQ